MHVIQLAQLYHVMERERESERDNKEMKLVAFVHILRGIKNV
jgi:hypothetical protein